MHVVIGLLTAIASLLWVLYRLEEMGISLGGLNPFHWRRRRAWAKRYNADPIYAVEDPMELAAIFVVAVAKLDGDISSEEKSLILAEFTSKFSLSERESAELLGSSVHLLGHPQIIETQVAGLLDKHKGVFTPEQAESLLEMMTKVVSLAVTKPEGQTKLIEAVRQKCSVPAPRGGAWG